jgi:F420-non-reducing hydrogenase iron-sulfur subunit
VLVPCTGRVEEILILRAFERGADGVMVVGCLEGDCHYQVGNLRARRRVERVAGLLDSAGLGGERVRMVNLSAGEGAKFVAQAIEMVEHITSLGPSPINRVRQGEPAVVADKSERNAGERP